MSLEGKNKHQLPVVLAVQEEGLDYENPFLDWVYQGFILEIRERFSCQELFFKILLTLHNAPGHPEHHQFETEGVK